MKLNSLVVVSHHPMERHKFIYLTGLLPTLVLAILMAFWYFFSAPALAWLGVLLSPLGIIIVLIGLWHAAKYYNDQSVSDKERRSRRQYFLKHTVVLSLGLAMSWVGFRTFSPHASFMGRAGQLEIRMKNTSDTPVKDLKLQIGKQTQTIPEIAARDDKILTVTVTEDTVLKAELDEEGLKREIQVQITPQDRSLFLRIDYQHNLLPEVQ